MHRISIGAAAIPDIENASSSRKPTSPSRLSWSPKRLAAAVPPELPVLHSCKHFLNLTNGLEAVPVLQSLQLPYGFVRIQSTFCEQQRFNPLLQNLDASLLLHLALGQWYGVEFISYILRRIWFQRCTEAWLRRQNVTSVFEQHLNALEGSTVKKIRYYMRYIPPGVSDVQLYGAYQATIHDPDPDYYRDIAHRHLQPAGQQSFANLHSTPPQQLQGGASAQDRLQDYGFKIFLGGMYHVNDFHTR